MTTKRRAAIPRPRVSSTRASGTLLMGTLVFLFDFQPAAAQDWWPMFHHDLNNTGYSTSTAPNTDNLRWTSEIGVFLASSAAVSDGRVFVAGVDDSTVYCLDADTGDVIWSYTTGNWVFSSPSVAAGRVYVGSNDHKVYCLDAQGNGDGTTDLIWTYTTGSDVTSSPAVIDGKVYVGSIDTDVYCLDAATGDLIWRFNTGSSILDSSPAVGDGKVWVGSSDGKVYCLPQEDPDDSGVIEPDEVIWSYQTGGYVESSPAIVDGKLYVGSLDDNLYCLNALTGAVIWTFPTGGNVVSSPAVAYGNVYFGSNDENVYSVPQNDPDGSGIIEPDEVIWTYPTVDAVECSPAVADGKVYVKTFQHFTCLDAVTGAEVWSYNTHHQTNKESSPAVVEGKVYVAVDDQVYAFGPSPPACEIVPTSLDFGTVMLGNYRDETFTITNVGGETVDGNVSEACNHYSIVSGGGAYSLGAGEWVEVTVRFEPAALGQHDCTIETGGAICDDVFSTGLGEATWVCGDGVIAWGAEECDDGGTTPGDGCDDICQVESGWTCAGEPSDCSICGDGGIGGLEQCDDGGTTLGDGCDDICNVESGWTCAGEPSVCTPLSVPSMSATGVAVLGVAVFGIGVMGLVIAAHRRLN